MPQYIVERKPLWTVDGVVPVGGMVELPEKIAAAFPNNLRLANPPVVPAGSAPAAAEKPARPAKAETGGGGK